MPFRSATLSLLLAFALGGAPRCQEPAPAIEAGPEALRARAWERLDREDPVEALFEFRRLLAVRPGERDALLGLGRTHLMLGHGAIALRYAGLRLAAASDDARAMALAIDALVRERRFEEAVRRVEDYSSLLDEIPAELLAAKGSAMFRVQRIEDAERAYRACLRVDNSFAEAHLRLGSGLMPPRVGRIPDSTRTAVELSLRGDLEGAERLLRRAVRESPESSVVHRLLAEVMLRRKAARSMAASDPWFAFVARRSAMGPIDQERARRFVDPYDDLSPRRRRIVDRALSLFASRLPALLASGAHHDLMGELESTSDSRWRRSLRGQRTFDGRYWDDVRGVGGLRAGTGIEALDEAAEYGFDTLVHELAHQVHYYALGADDRRAISGLYERAKTSGTFLDYYAASNEAEYFAQGVEAFASLVKRPGCETTHGHTRFELYRVDPMLHDLIARLVDRDLLSQGESREPLLVAACEAALRSGRPLDARTACEWMAPSAEREWLLARCRTALAAVHGL
ncbi:MAG: hypothetical protein Fur0037_24250 [Planctomycetota bacterium]